MIDHNTIHIQAFRLIDDSNWNDLSVETQRIMLSQRVLVQQHNRTGWQKLIDAVTEWCIENATGLFRVTPRGHGEGRFEAIVWFEQESDAVNIKLCLQGEVLDT